MNLQVKRIQGGRFSAEDKLETAFASDDVDISVLRLSVIVVSGVEITHGGGAPSTQELHYKSEQDADAEGVIDYSTCIMDVVQAEKGTSVVKIKGSYLTKQEAQENYQAWVDRQAGIDSGEIVIEEGGTEYQSPHTGTELSTGELTLEWLDDTFV